ncbi:MAG: HdeD family acid-resistance protein [Cyanobacteriota bacterium]
MPSGATFNSPDDEVFTGGETALTRQALQAGRLKGLTQAEGIVMIVLGLLALFFPVVASAGVTVMVAVAFLVAGLMGWVDAFSRGRRLTRWHGFLRLVVASLFLYAGLWMLLQFKAGVVPAAQQIKLLATAVGLVFLVEGGVMRVLALAHRHAAGWGWGLLNGLVTLALGLLITTMSPAGLLSVLGLLVGISFLFSGIDLLGFSARLHGPGSPTTAP